MRLVRLDLENFRQHARTGITFRSGVTGIIGPNGAGKSTILEAIAWAIYGSTAARGTNETIRFSRAPRRSRVEVDLTFELGGHEYRVVRTMHEAKVFVDGGSDPVASGMAGAATYLQSRLGMNREEFFNTYFTGQKELQFLANMGPTQRGRFLSRLLGYERLRLAQDRVRERRNEIRHELDGLRAAQADPLELENAVESAEQRLGTANRELDEAETTRAEAAAGLVAIVPRWNAIQKDRDRAREQEYTLDTERKELEAATRDEEKAARALVAIEEADAELKPVHEELRQMPDAATALERFESLARAQERRDVLERGVQSVRRELADTVRRIETLETVPTLVNKYGAELEALRESQAELEATVETLNADWSGKRQETSTRLETYRKSAQELRDKIRELKKAGPDGTCPTCERPLRDEFDNVVGRLEDEYLSLVQDGKWLNQREKQLATKPEELAEAERKRDEARAESADLSQKIARCEQAVQELWTLAQDRKRREQQLLELQEELERQPGGYDPDAHRNAQERVERLRELERRAAGLTSIVAGREAHEHDRVEARKRITAARRRISRLEKDTVKLAFSEEELASVRAAHQAAADALHKSELHAVEAAGHVQTAEEAHRGAQRELRQFRKREAAARSLEVEFRYHNELDAALSHLRQDLNARVRPELSELGSAFLSDVTEGRYSSLEIDENYNVLVLDEGEEKPVISGGEEDIANLVLRLAISQMIAERAGQQLSILILDEVFGSLDVEHRENVVQLLHRLEGRFEQVILITHIEGIREGLDNVIRVEYDERAGASRVSEESIAGGYPLQLV
ncbi:MAG: SMC family ATPase [Gemmatimonadota bacterium]|jgi:exonuclease SbcC